MRDMTFEKITTSGEKFVWAHVEKPFTKKAAVIVGEKITEMGFEKIDILEAVACQLALQPPGSLPLRFFYQKSSLKDCTNLATPKVLKYPSYLLDVRLKVCLIICTYQSFCRSRRVSTDEEHSWKD